MHINLELEDPKTVVSPPPWFLKRISSSCLAWVVPGDLPHRGAPPGFKNIYWRVGGSNLKRESFLWKWVYGIGGAIYRGCNLRDTGLAPGLKKGISPEFHRPWVGVDFDTRGTGGWRDVSRDVPERVQNCPWF